MEPADETIELLQRWHGGDAAALAKLVERDRTWVEQQVRRRRGEPLRRHGETVDDVQDLMVRALQYAPRFVCANRRQFRGLLVRMIGNVLADKARRLDRREPPLSLAAASQSRLHLDPSLTSATGPCEAAARNEDLAWMQLGMDFLDAADRDLVRQRQFLERGFAEIAADLGATPDGVRMRFQRALLRLAGIVQRLQGGQLDALLAEQPPAE
jgi:DNA-directed RNA polymerase specialized sigma24 family protein